MVDKLRPADCCGCYACATICPTHCITFEEDWEGFWYPKIEKEKCVGCKLCMQTCPTQKLKREKLYTAPIAYGAMNKNEDLRLKSSSGGVFCLLAKKVLEQHGVVFGAAFDSGFRNVQHIYVEQLTDLEKLYGSKYIQSKIGNCYEEAEAFLKNGRSVLFTGTPCQIEGLKAFLKKDYDLLYCMDLVCHGVPSPKVWRKYLDYQERLAEGQVTGIQMRSKPAGWKKFAITISMSSGKQYQASASEDLYMRSFLQNICLRPSCAECHFKGLNRTSDITVADFWGVQKIAPTLDDDKGTSLVLIHSAKGQELFDLVSNNLRWQRTQTEVAISENSAASISVTAHPKRSSFFNDLEKVEFPVLVKRYVKPDRNIKTIAQKIIRKLFHKRKRN